MKKSSFAILSLLLMFTYPFALADEAIPTPDTGTQQAPPDTDTDTDTGDAEADC